MTPNEDDFFLTMKSHREDIAHKREYIEGTKNNRLIF